MTTATYARASGSPAPAERPVVRYNLPVRIVISAFIAFHIAAVLLLIMPDNALRRLVRPVTGNYISHVGLWQHWGMFAPEPSNLNYYVSATITYQDGSRREWLWPRMGEYDYARRYQKERYRKFVEYARMDRFGFMWPSMSRYIAQINNEDPANLPVHVRLTRSWWFVTLSSQRESAKEDATPHWSSFSFFEMPITPQDLTP